MDWWLSKILIALIVTLVLSGCVFFERTGAPVSPATRSFLMPPPTFREADLIGRWQNTNTMYQVETLILTADRRFVHVFDMRNGQPAQDQGTWRIEQRASGCVYLHLEGMRYFYSGESFALYGNRSEPGGEPYPFWDRCEQQWVLMPDQVILTVSNRPNMPRGIGLLYLATKNPPDSSVELMLIADADGHPLPTVTPSRP